MAVDIESDLLKKLMVEKYKNVLLDIRNNNANNKPCGYVDNPHEPCPEKPWITSASCCGQSCVIHGEMVRKLGLQFVDRELSTVGDNK